MVLEIPDKVYVCMLHGFGRLVIIRYPSLLLLLFFFGWLFEICRVRTMDRVRSLFERYVML